MNRTMSESVCAAVARPLSSGPVSGLLGPVSVRLQPFTIVQPFIAIVPESGVAAPRAVSTPKAEPDAGLPPEAVGC